MLGRVVGLASLLLLSLVLPGRSGGGSSVPPEELLRKRGPAVAVVLADGSGGGSLGTGFFISGDGLLVTNHHVIAGATRIRVRLTDQRTLTVERVVASDRAADLALLKVAGLRVAPHVVLGKPTHPPAGSRVFVIGSPQGLANTITEGLLSGSRDVGGGRRLLQISAAISPGSSGSPVFDSAGRVVGVACSMLVGGQSINFAVPIEYLQTLRRGAPVGRVVRALARPRAAGRDGLPPVRVTDCLVLPTVDPNHGDPQRFLNWSPDGRFLASGAFEEGGRITVWDAATGASACQFVAQPDKEHPGTDLGLDSAEWSADGRMLAVGSWKEVTIWDSLQDASVDVSPEGHGGAAVWQPHGHQVVFSGWKGRLSIWRPGLKSAEPLQLFSSSDPEWDAAGDRIAFISMDDRLVVDDIPGGGKAVTVAGGFAWSRPRVSWSPDGALIAVSGFSAPSEQINVYAVKTRRLVATLRAESVERLEWSPASDFLAFGGIERLFVWRRSTRRVAVSMAGELPGSWGSIARGRSLAWSGHRLAFMTSSGTKRACGAVRVWDAQSGAVRVLDLMEGTIAYSLAWRGDGKLIAVGDTNNSVSVFDCGTGRQIVTFAAKTGLGENVTSIAWSPDGSRIAAGYEDDKVRLWTFRERWLTAGQGRGSHR